MKNRTAVFKYSIIGKTTFTENISRLVKGMTVDEAIERLQGIRCGQKATSCPDQLSLALKEYLSNNQ